MKTAIFSHVDDANRALHQFEQNPVRKTFSLLVAHLVLQSAQKFLTTLQANELMAAYWRYTNPNVVIFESAAYFWSMVSFDTNETVRYAFDDDKNAVNGSMLEAFNQANAIIRDTWFGFSPEVYALSRLFLYPKEKTAATEHFFSVIALSEGRDFPLFPGEISRATPEGMPPNFALNTQDRGLCHTIATDLIRATASHLAYYLNYRED